MKCYNCGNEIEISTIVGRTEECPKCRSDAHVCLNCSFFDKSAYNECKESNAERVVEKNRRNFCDYFRPGTNLVQNSSKSKEDILKELDNLFKK